MRIKRPAWRRGDHSELDRGCVYERDHSYHAPSVAAPGSAAPSGAASPSGSAAGEQYTIGFVVPLISNPYWKLMQDFAQGAAGTLGMTCKRRKPIVMKASRSRSSKG